jgi:glycosyltransferase involved in cell wall biosynthesis
LIRKARSPNASQGSGKSVASHETRRDQLPEAELSQENRPGRVLTIICNDAHYFNRHRRTVADRLIEKGSDVLVLAGGDASGITLPFSFKFRVIGIERFGFSAKRDSQLFLETLRDIFSRRPQVLHLITLKPAVVSGIAGALAGMVFGAPRRIVILIAGLGRLMSADSELRGKHRISRFIVNSVIWWLARRKGVIFLFETQSDRSSWIAKGLVLETNSETVMGAGVSAEKFYPAATPRATLPLRLLFAARLLPTKGFDAFLEVARQFESNKHVEFLVAGLNDHSDREVVREMDLADEKSIRFLGEVSDMPSLLRSVDIVCLPSRYGEGIPRILIEAAACGLPSIASDLAGCREIVEDGVTGVIVPTGPKAVTAAAMTTAVQRYLVDRDLVRRHGAAALSKFRMGGFEAKLITKRFIELLHG